MIDLAENLQRSAKKLLLNPSTKSVQDYVHDSVELIGKLINEFVALKAEKESLESLCEQRRRGAENIVNELAIADKEIAELKAKLVEIEKQEPIGYVPKDIDRQFNGFGYARIDKFKKDWAQIPLYSSPVQQSPAVAVPDEWKNEWKSNVMKLWGCARKHESSIPDDQLDFMREYLLSTPTPSAEPTHWCNKCGYSGLFIVHDNCPYSAIQIKREAE